MQVFYKILITIVVFVFVLLPALMFLEWTWTSDIDHKQTTSRIFNFLFKHKSELIATRDHKKIYQNGLEVGNITGSVTISDGYIVFDEVCETGKLDKQNPFEYRNYRLKIIDIGQELDLCGSPLKRDVKRSMRCEILP